MSRCTEHTRQKKGGATCDICGGAIEPGDRYRQRIAINEDYTETDYERSIAHVSCVSRDECWALFKDPPPWQKPPLGELTEHEQRIILHTLGIGSHIDQRRHGYRNGYSATKGGDRCALLEGMADKGLLRGRPVSVAEGLLYYHATRKGGAAVGRPDLGVST